VFGTYAQILRFPGALAFSMTGLFARLQLSMASLGMTLLIVAERGSYGLAAGVTSTYALAGAIIAPQVSRKIDQFGQRRILPLQLAVHVPAVLGLIYVTTLDGLVPVLFVLAFLAGAAQLSVGSLVRARWSKIYTGTTQLRTAFAWESLLDEVVFISGPPLATVLALQIAPSAALLVATLVLTVGCSLLILQRSTQPMPSGISSSSARDSALLLPGMLGLTGIFAFVGGVFGSFEMTTISFAQEHGVEAYTGLLLALYAVGSFVAGFGFGAMSFRASVPRQFLIALVAMAVVTAPLSLFADPVLMGVAAFVAGVAVAPALISGMSLIETIVPSVRLTESMTWATGGLSVGLAVGLLLSGLIVDIADASFGYLVTSACALGALVVGLLVRHRLAAAFRATHRVPVDAVA
jgi:hypothetical protein